MGKVHSLKVEQKIPAGLDEVWGFISSPKNLKEITPEYMGFDILTKEDISTMYQGMIINYIVRPVMGIPMHWTTEITTVEDRHYFIDEQRFGPYALWHHKHFLQPIDGGVLMTDLVHYKLPFGWIGNLGLPYVKSKLRGIFDFRFKALEQKFGIYQTR